MSKSRQWGLSLIECCVSMTIVSVLATSAATSFKDLKERRRLDGRSAELSTDLHFLRTEAVSRNQTLRLTLMTDSGGACYVMHNGDAQGCECGSDGTTACQAGVQLIKAQHLPAAEGVALSAKVTHIAIASRNGTATPGGTLVLSDSQGHEIRHVLAMTGRQRVCSAGVSWNHLPPC